jgi:hypothetical protein
MTIAKFIYWVGPAYDCVLAFQTAASSRLGRLARFHQAVNKNKEGVITRMIFSAVLSCFAVPAAAASFNYHGTLQDSGKPADGQYDLQLTLYSAAQGGQVLGGPLTVYKVPVHDGAFSTQVDFGAVQNPPGGAWLGVQVRKADTGDFAALDARAPVDVAETAATSSVCPGAWTLSGNAGNPAGSYLGTADNNPLIFKANGLQAGSLIPTAGATYTDAPNVVFGSSGNSVGTAQGATIGGGGTSFTSNCGGPCTNTASANFSTVGGGFYNIASGPDSTISGGSENLASGFTSTISGGQGNIAGGNYSIVSGGINNRAQGDYSFAAGVGASVRPTDKGTFVWSGDWTATNDFTSTGASQFLVNATGGVGIGTNNPAGYQLRVVASGSGVRGETSNGSAWAVSGVNTGTSGNGSGVLGVTASTQGYGVAGSATASGGVGVLGYASNAGGYGVVAGNTAGGQALLVQGTGSVSGRVINSDVGGYLSSGGQWVNKSDRAAKAGFQTLDVGHILNEVVAMPVTRWFYKAEGDGIHHIGPVAQDFHAAFGLGSDDKSIGTVDEGGVALAAIQGLNKKLEADNAALKAKLADVLARLDRLEKAQGK